MSRQIDLTSALSDEDRAYLEARGRHSDIARADAAAEGREWDESMLTAGEVLSHDDVRLAPNTGDVNPLPLEERPQPWGDVDNGDEPELQEIGQTGGEELDYGQFTVAQLKAEIDRRNEERDEDSKLSKSGKHDELVARLTEDDQEAADEDEES